MTLDFNIHMTPEEFQRHYGFWPTKDKYELIEITYHQSIRKDFRME